MPLLLKFNLLCNFCTDGPGCLYCYQEPFRPESQNIDYVAVEKTLRTLHEKTVRRDKEGKPIRGKDGVIGERVVLHGGEPLFQDKSIIEHFLKLGYELSGKSSIQTNGYLIDDDHIRMFKKYKTGVGVSIDGPWNCNDLRGSGSRENRKLQTEQSIKNLYKLVDSGLKPSIISVIHKHNALGDRREIFKNWIRELNHRGINGRMNPCWSNNPEIDLTPEEAVDFYTNMYDFLEREGIKGWSPFVDVKNGLLEDGRTECKFGTCDPFRSPSATTILEDGRVGVCLRLYDEKGEYNRNSQFSGIRSEILRQTDCKDCDYWKYCYGGCCGTPVDNDWRNKDYFCLAWKALFDRTMKTLRFLSVPKPQAKPKKVLERRGGDYTDGHLHSDGNSTHYDSDRGDEDE